MKRFPFTPGILAAAVVAASMTMTPLQSVSAQNAGMDKKRMAEQMLTSWPQASQMAAKMMMEQYGPPAETTESMLIWNKTGPWKRTIIYNYEVQHNFPGPHTDVMQQFIDYRVPPDMVDELAEFDGSVVVNRTNGEISARCDLEAANFLALNLAHQVATGKLSVEAARKMYGEQITAKKAGQPAPLTERLDFTVPSGGTADPDKPLGGM